MNSNSLEKSVLRAVVDAGNTLLHGQLCREVAEKANVKTPLVWNALDDLEDAKHIEGECLPWPEGYQWHLTPKGAAHLAQLEASE